MIRMRNLAPDVRARLATAGVTINPAANVYYVSSTSANAGTTARLGTDPTQPYSTLAALIAGVTLVAGDLIVLLPGHAETVIAAAGISLGKANITVIGIGDGDARPTFTFATSTAATWTIANAGTTIANIIVTNTLDQVVSPLVISAAGCSLVDVEIQDSATNVEFVNGVLTTAGAARLRITRMKYLGQSGGSHCVDAIKLVGVVHGDIDIDFFGKASTSVVEFATTLCSDIKVTGTMFNTATTDLTKVVTDTITASIWSALYYDESAGRMAQGGSASALGLVDVQPRRAIMTKADVTVATAWTTGNSPITLFTVTGRVLMRIAAFTTAAFTSTATTGTLALGVAAATTLFMGTTTANGTNFPAANVPWVGTTAVVGAALQQNASQWFLNASANVILTVATNSMTAGGMVLVCEWIPLSAGATVVAAAS